MADYDYSITVRFMRNIADDSAALAARRKPLNAHNLAVQLAREIQGGFDAANIAATFKLTL